MVSALLPLGACGSDPPQIVDYAPQRGAVDVSTAAPITISFDHDVDKTSVQSRLHLNPQTSGTVRWLSGRQLVYEHATLQPDATYEVVLEAGYRDTSGNVYPLRHHWAFVTEGPPSLLSSAPAAGDNGVDPAAYISLDFSRNMDPSTFASALTFTPSTPFIARLDPADAKRVIVAPSQLLEPNTSYQLALNTGVLDVDGNQLDRDQTIGFSTGPARPLRGWITFATSSADGSPAGLWMVNDSAFPRQLFTSSPVHSFSWSPSGNTMLVQGDGESWSELTPGVGSVALGFKGTWAAALASGMGYVYVDDGGNLHRQTSDGRDETIAADVAQAAVSPNGLRLAFIGPGSPDKIWGYDVGLRVRYQLALDTAPVGSVTWAPSGNRIAYLRTDLQTTTMRVRNLGGSGATTTIASGDVSAPLWMADSTHILFAAGDSASTTGHHKAFVVNVAAPPASISIASGLPVDPAIDVLSPIPSPDGHQIAFLNGDQVWLMNADGTRPVQLTRLDPESFPYSCRTPAWTRG